MFFTCVNHLDSDKRLRVLLQAPCPALPLPLRLTFSPAPARPSPPPPFHPPRRKGNSAENIGYSCLFRELINGFRALWSATPGTTDPLAPFGAVALPSGGSEGGPNMGAMRLAQTLGYGVLPTPAMPNTWSEWGGVRRPRAGALHPPRDA
jgi:hypothetical protein